MANHINRRSQEFREMLANEYLSTTISISELSRKYQTDAIYQLKKLGIPLKGRGVQKMLTRTGCIKYNWDASKVETEKQAYVLGFLMADGYYSGFQVGLRLKKDDLMILKKIRDCFSEEIKIQEEETAYGFVISSTVICDNLNRLGIIRHKSQNEKYIPVLRDDLVRHFIRGYFDGDGTVFVCHNGKNQFLKCNICSSTKNILVEIQEILTANGIYSVINSEKRIGKVYRVKDQYDSVATMDMNRLFIRRKGDIQKLYHYLYDDASIYLDRKYKVFADNQWMLVYRHANTELTEQIAKGCSAV